MSTPNIQQLLQQAETLGLERVDAHWLLLHAAGKRQSDRTWLLAHDDVVLGADVQTRFSTYCQRRLAGEPVAYIVGSKSFFGMDLQVDNRVLVPRPDTETLVEWALSLPAIRTVLDLGTGSGAIALALKHVRPDWEITAVDYSAEALTVAQGNANRLGLKVEFVRSAWFDALKTPHGQARFDLIVSNPPYIALGDPHMDALKHEPQQALTSGKDGLQDIRLIIQDAPTFLNSGAWLLFEHGYDQAARVRELLMLQGFSQVHSKLDLAGIERCSGGQWLASE
ncbi:MAG TPA: peptide chain release factor N(5)-glutamine methyltransferase [Burkholderiaceae bacterium]|nr:peptide chain release factor N(5)-glutamine methyltransferase [Burkholderiaceae bacterium]